MITSIIVHRCPHCNSEDICRNGHDYKGAQKYHCHRCKSYGTLHARQGYREEEKELILRAYQERASMRGVERIFGTVRQTLARWIQEKAAKLPAMEATLLAAEPDDVLELDELWSFVRTKRNQRLGLDCPLSSNPTGRRLLHRRPQRRQLPGFAPAHPPKLQLLLFLQRLLGGVSIGLRRRNAPRRGQGNRRNRPRRTLEQHPATTFGPLCAQDPGFFPSPTTFTTRP